MTMDVPVPVLDVTEPPETRLQVAWYDVTEVPLAARYETVNGPVDPGADPETTVTPVGALGAASGMIGFEGGEKGPVPVLLVVFAWHV